MASYSKLDEIKSYLLGLKETKTICLTFGRYDLAGKFIFETLTDFQRFQEEFYTRFGEYVYSLQADDYFEELHYDSQLGMKCLIKEKKGK